MPILGFAPDERVRQQLSISWGATPITLSGFADNEEMVREAVQTARPAKKATAKRLARRPGLRRWACS